MDFLPAAFNTLKLYKQFIVYTLNGKVKRPVHHVTGQVCDAHNPLSWTDADTAIAAAKRLGNMCGVGFVFTDKDPFFFLDIDSCYDNGWSELSKELLSKLSGAAVEVSSSQRGLHVIGTCKPFDHNCRNSDLGIELYTSKRFVALTGMHASGDVSFDCTEAIQQIASTYFKSDKKALGDKEWWSDKPVDEWKGPEDDDELLRMALASQSLKSKFGQATSARFADLWENNEQVLAQFYPPDPNSGEPYNRSSVDAALAQHLCYWTGSNAERILRLMLRSKLVRDKWERDDYLPRTIRNARGNNSGCLILEKSNTNQTVSTSASSGVFLTIPEQQIHFDQCVYICDDNAIYTPGGYVLDKERFNVMYGGKVFILDATNSKTTTKSWEAFTQSTAIRFPKVHRSTFRPDLKPGEIITRDSELIVNTYWPYRCERKKGDISPFLYHIEKLSPDPRDQEILINYMAALVQFLGKKFKWCIVLQGTQGNGKTLLSRCVSYIIGDRYTRAPRADKIDGKFNDWLYESCFVTIEDVFYQDRNEIIEILKPMLDLDRMMIEGKNRKDIMKDICCNFIINTNHKEGLRKTKDDRRFAVFYTAQQSVEDLKRDQMWGDYFPDRYNWLKREGFAYVADWLLDYPIRDEFNPLINTRAPTTSSTEIAIRQSLGRVEHEILEAIDSERVGFKGGWVSSTALNTLLKDSGSDKRIPHNRRRELMQSLGYDWHPGLKEGRVTTMMQGENSKPRLYIKLDHKHRDLTDSHKIVEAYKDAQK